MRKRGKVDALQAEIVSALRRCGCSVLVLSNVGQGVPDLLVGRNRVTHMLEVKDPAGALTDAQRSWFGDWRGSPVHVVRSENDALKAVGVIAR